ncbi:MAG: tRNA guanosine(34) transglycosylase Tgt [Dehalococcoidia bacterium]|nr:tRNA guanosine(34) transglycosylase Tgt [Dehalococcoidia bacterium]
MTIGVPHWFAILATQRGARRARMSLRRATVDTPAFMPVGTLANVKTLTTADLGALGYHLILANTYHLHLRPGDDVIARFGGVTTFMGWDGALLTDSGGYQVFSLSDIRDVDDDGVTFHSPFGVCRLTPERAMHIQRNLGSDIAMALDDVPAIDASPEAQRQATERTHRWAARCLAAPMDDWQRRFAIVQGGRDPDWRSASARTLAALPFDGYAVGGLALGEDPALTSALTAAATCDLPPTKPRYLMGVGSPNEIIDAVANGIDLFDSVLPTRIARHGAIFTKGGRVSLKAARFAADPGPLDDGCDCLACLRYSRGWVRHWLLVGEPLGMRLATLHNLRFLWRLMDAIRRAIESASFDPERFKAGDWT